VNRVNKKAEIRRVNCIVCPLSCVGEVSVAAGQITGVAGFACPRGQAYAREEVTAPKRMLTGTVRVSGGRLPLLPVVSRQPLPKDKIMDCARCLSTVTVSAPVKEGDVVLADILGLGVDVVASRDLAAQQAVPKGAAG
jgi:CxxC motif-containing protein